MMKGNKHWNWKGGVHKDKDGYILIYTPNGRMREHRYKMEKKLKRKLLKNEYVHHINGIKTDNRIKNLTIMLDSDHSSFHNNRKSNGKWSKNYSCCVHCGTKELEHKAKGLCKHCYYYEEKAPNGYLEKHPIIRGKIRKYNGKRKYKWFKLQLSKDKNL